MSDDYSPKGWCDIQPHFEALETRLLVTVNLAIDVYDTVCATACYGVFVVTPIAEHEEALDGKGELVVTVTVSSDSCISIAVRSLPHEGHDIDTQLAWDYFQSLQFEWNDSSAEIYVPGEVYQPEFLIDTAIDCADALVETDYWTAIWDRLSERNLAVAELDSTELEAVTTEDQPAEIVPRSLGRLCGHVSLERYPLAA